MKKTTSAIFALVIASASPLHGEEMSVAKTVMQTPEGRFTFMAEIPKRPAETSAKFTHRFCNDSGEEMNVALAHPETVGGRGWRFQGWYVLKAGGCFTVSIPSAGYAESQLLYHSHSSYQMVGTSGTSPGKANFRLPGGRFDFVNLTDEGLPIDGDLYSFDKEIMKLGTEQTTSITQSS